MHAARLKNGDLLRPIFEDRVHALRWPYTKWFDKLRNW